MLRRTAQRWRSDRLLAHSCPGWRSVHAGSRLAGAAPARAPTPEPAIDLPALFPTSQAFTLDPSARAPVERQELSEFAVKRMKALSPSLVEENVALLDAHLRVGNIDIASRMFHQLWRRNPATMELFTTVPLLNKFVEAHVVHVEPQLAGAATWFAFFDELREKRGCSNVRRDLDSFVHMLHGQLRVRDGDAIRQLVADAATELDVGAGGLVSRTRELYPETIPHLQRALAVLGVEVPVADYAEGLSGSIDAAEVGKPPEGSAPDANGLLAVQAVGVGALRTAMKVVNTSNLSLYEQQRRLEEEGYKIAVDEMAQTRRDGKISPAEATIPKQLVLKWHEALVDELRRALGALPGLNGQADAADARSLSAREAAAAAAAAAVRGTGQVLAGDRAGHEQEACMLFLSLVDVEKTSLIAITEFLRHHSIHGGIAEVRSTMLFRAIGTAIEREYALERLKLRRNRELLQQRFTSWRLGTSGKMFDNRLRSVARKIEQEGLEAELGWVPKWPDQVQVRVGALVSDLAIAVCRVQVGSVDEPAFVHGTVIQRGRKYGVVRYAQPLTEILSREPLRETLNPRMLPMLVTPRPWLTWRSGGYLESPTECVRVRGNVVHRDYIKEADARGHLSLVLQALDVLGRTAWRVNARVYEVAAEIWNSGKPFSDIPGVEKAPPPERPADMETNRDAARRYWREYYEWTNTLQSLYSMRCDTNYKVEIARTFLGKTMYFPHNLDFRGRAYPIPPHLNHIGNDLCRGLMLFDEAKPLGNDGLRWLHIQVANLYGADKISFEERVAFTHEHLDSVRDSARDPLGGQRWWAGAADPWQCLAACIELDAALKLENPAQYESRLPIHQDGTCNGLQHYAALGGDLKGAQQVNLMPSGKPQDVYSGVAAVVREQVEADAAEGVKEAQILRGMITRKLVKQTVMTNTYGVTFIGAKAQIYQRLRELKQEHLVRGDAPEPWMTDDKMRGMAAYVAKHTFSALSTLFSGARAIQDWLNVAAALIARSVDAKSVPAQEVELGRWLVEQGILDGGESDKSSDESAAPNRRVLVGLAHQQARAEMEPATLQLGAEEEEDGEDWLIDDIFGQGHRDEAARPSKPPRAPAKASGRKTDKSGKSGAAQVAKMTSVTWTTPLGLPIVQPYRQQYVKTVKTNLQTVNVLDMHQLGPVNARKQSSAFPPNFIHSLDASHMMLSAIACQRHGLVFAAVHDSYWTHACDVGRMNNILRECFVKLHSDDVMQRLLAEFQQRYAGHFVPVTVELTASQANAVLAASEVHGWHVRLGTRKASPAASAAEAGDAEAGDVEADGEPEPVYTLQTWTELRFPPLPAKGPYDVTQVKSSSYFFH